MDPVCVCVCRKGLRRIQEARVLHVYTVYQAAHALLSIQERRVCSYRTFGMRLGGIYFRYKMMFSYAQRVTSCVECVDVLSMVHYTAG